MAMRNRYGRFSHRAFSLLELLAVVTIIGIIAAITVPRVAVHAFTAKQKACLQYRSDLNTALERYTFDNGAPPAQLTDIENSNYYPDEIPLCPVDNVAYTMDSSTARVSGHNH